MRSKLSGLLLIVVPLFMSHAVWGATHTAASCSQADVQAAINAASAGDIVRLPAGTGTWSSGLSISKGIHLQGAGGGGFIGHSRTSLTIGTGAKTFVTQAGLSLQVGQTVRALYIANGTRYMEGSVSSYSGTSLQLNITRVGGSGTYPAWVLAIPAQTTLVNNAANDWGWGMLDVSEDTAASLEISGIRFKSGTATYGSHLNLSRTVGGRPVRIHDCWFTQNGEIGRSILAMSNRGIIYRCSFDGGLEDGVPEMVHTGVTLRWSGEGANQSWSTPDTMGAKDTSGLNNFYVEDCYFAGAQCFDFDDNSRTVVRHCVINNSNIATHGADTSVEGLRHFELYDNTFLFDVLGDDTLNVLRWIWLRGGTGIITDNVIPDLKSQMWGDGDEIQMIVMSLRRDCNYAGYPYPVPHQVGQGHNGTQPVLDPLYVWNNAGNPRVGMNDYEPDEVGLDLHTADYLKLGRDYYVDVAKPGYVKYAYPHPLRGATPPPQTPPAISAQPQSVSVTVGQSATFSVTATGTAPLAYQWRKNSVNISGATGAAYTTPATTLADNGAKFSVFISNVQGNATSSEATLSVTSSSGPPALPQGNNGIAARFPGDANIQSDSAVLFADNFESYTSASGLTSRWNEMYHLPNARIATETGNVFAGGKALEFKIPQGSPEVSNAAIKYVSPTADTLFVRFYTKFDPGYSVVGSGHNGLAIQANYSGPGVPANGSNKFYVGLENSRDYASLLSPGPTHLYIYHPEQRDIWGDHWYPTGRVVPFDAIPGDFGPYFVSRPEETPQLNRWYCYEMMVKANTPGQRDGRIAFWIDGTLKADFLNVRLRDVSSLKIDKFVLGLHINGDTSRENKKWYDNVVAARSYIGPLFSTSGDSTAPTVALTAPASGATVSGTAVTVSASASDNVGVVGVQFKLDGANLGSEDTAAPYSVSWNTIGAATGSHALTAVARDAAGNTKTATAVTVNVLNNRPPALVSAASVTPNPAEVAQMLSFSVAASDPDGNSLSYAWNFGDGSSAAGASATHAYIAAGTFSAAVTVSDGKGGSVSSSVIIAVSNPMVVHWKFDETSGTSAVDSSGRGNSGSLRTGAVWTAGIRGGAVSLDGAGGGVIKNPVTAFPSTALTAAFWMKSSDRTKAGTPLSYAVAAQNNEFLIYNYNNLAVYVKGSYVTTGVRANDGLWHHIAVSWRSSDGQMVLYKDGAAVSTKTLRAGAVLSGNGSLFAGQEQDSVGGGLQVSQAFRGSMDDVRIYNRVLSVSEISALSSPSAGGTPQAETIVPSSDRDGDGLLDEYEQSASLDPLSVDGDGNDTLDPDELAAEGLTHLQAQQLWLQQQQGGGATPDPIIDLGTVKVGKPLRLTLALPEALVGARRSLWKALDKGQLPKGLKVGRARLGGRPAAAGVSVFTLQIEATVKARNAEGKVSSSKQSVQVTYRLTVRQ